jgi:hypothetical protein
MATATAIIAGVGGITSMATSLASQKKAQSAINKFKWKELKNPFDELAVSTMGTDRALEESARNTATSVDALQSGGVRGVVGGISKIQEQSNKVAQNVTQNLEEQQKQLDYKKTQVEYQNQQTESKRQEQELAGYGNLLNQSNKGFMQGMGMLANGVGAFGQTKAGQNLETNIFGEKED